jgi:hypothetical protein
MVRAWCEKEMSSFSDETELYPAECNRDVPSPIGCIVAVHIQNGPKTKVVVLHRPLPEDAVVLFLDFTFLLSPHQTAGTKRRGRAGPTGRKSHH